MYNLPIRRITITLKINLFIDKSVIKIDLLGRPEIAPLACTIIKTKKVKNFLLMQIDIYISSYRVAILFSGLTLPHVCT